jgi:glutamate dehydrogenase
MYDFREEGRQTLERAARAGAMDPALLELLREPLRVIAFRIPLRMDDGRLEVFNAWRVRYNDALGPCRDGTRISPDLDEAECRSLALLMTIKHAAGAIPAGGGKGGVCADPRELSRWELERLCRAYIRGIQPAGPGLDVPGADIGTSLETMAWMLDEHEQITGGHAPAAINDKPSILGGSPGGEEATGEGVFDVFEAAASELGLARGARVAIQGFGQVGAMAATCFQQAGYRVVAVSDSGSGIYRAEGLDLDQVRAHKAQAGKLAGFAGAEAMTNAELLTCDCDVLVPAAVQGVITADNAADVSARLVVEAANGPTTLDAHDILVDQGVTLVPDVLANAGSVQVCQMERTQGLSDQQWDRETVRDLRRRRLLDAYRQAQRAADRHGLDSLRLGAWIHALERVQEAARLRGWAG